MTNRYKVEGIIIGRRNIGEADKLVTIFTKQNGKKTVIAKGVRKTQSRRASHVELFTVVQLVLYKRKTLDIVVEAQAIESFPFLRKRLERVGYAYVCAELVEKMTAELQESSNIYYKLYEILTILNLKYTKRYQAQVKLQQFKQFLLTELGFSARSESLTKEKLDQFIESVVERPIKSHLLLTNIQARL